MRKTLAPIAIIFSVAVLFFACATQPTQPALKSYQAKSPDEAKILIRPLHLGHVKGSTSYIFWINWPSFSGIVWMIHPIPKLRVLVHRDLVFSVCPGKHYYNSHSI